MRVANLTALEYQAAGDRLRVVFDTVAPDRVEALDGSPILVVSTDQGEVVELLRGFTRLSKVGIDREKGTVTAEFRHVSDAEVRLAELGAESLLKTARIAALTEQNDFQEELIVALANQVYG